MTLGQILIGGHDIRRISRAELVKALGFVSQRGVLFSGTVTGNIKYADEDISDKEMRRAAKIAQADFIEELDGKYKARIAQGGNNVSGGQKQRLSIARAMLANAPITILDEATSNVDTRTERLIQQAMDKLVEGRTSFVIAHRLSTIRNADLILVMDHGDIVESGTHDSLLEQNGFYAKLYNAQFAH